jgi:formylglycine-generating enzyme required for sulfatase activity
VFAEDGRERAFVELKQEVARLKERQVEQEKRLLEAVVAQGKLEARLRQMEEVGRQKDVEGKREKERFEGEVKRLLGGLAERLSAVESGQKGHFSEMKRRMVDFSMWAGGKEEGKSLHKASDWYVKACELGEALGCRKAWVVGLRWCKVAEAAPSHWDAADQWYDDACKQGFVEGCGWKREAWFQRGEWLRQRERKAEAMLWYVKACGLGSDLACQAKNVLTRAGGERKILQVKGVAFAMRWIPAGTFVMGSPSREAGRYDDEGPQRSVRISKGFWMLETEVTQGQWKALMGTNPSRFKDCGENCPVEQVSWEEARGFADKLSNAEGLSACTATDSEIFKCVGWRLPTEAEWEYAARAGTTGERYGEVDSVAWYGGNSDGKTHPVGGKRANVWGLHDMLGNVWEWVMDGRGSSYAGLAAVDPLRTEGGTRRVIRGGGWGSDARSVRSASRYGFAPAFRASALGFRLLRY